MEKQSVSNRDISDRHGKQGESTNKAVLVTIKA